MADEIPKGICNTLNIMKMKKYAKQDNKLSGQMGTDSNVEN
jgi:hypothetical protein